MIGNQNERTNTSVDQNETLNPSIAERAAEAPCFAAVRGLGGVKWQLFTRAIV